MVIVSNPRTFKIPDWFLNRQKDHKDGRFSQLTSSALDTKLREDLERLKKIRYKRAASKVWNAFFDTFRRTRLAKQSGDFPCMLKSVAGCKASSGVAYWSVVKCLAKERPAVAHVPH